jgi:hypothetical protein
MHCEGNIVPLGRCEHPDDVRAAIEATLQSPQAALLEAVVDADEKPAKPEELKA